MDATANSLSLEQEFNHRVFGEQVKQLSHEQAQSLLLEMHKQMLYKDNLYKELILGQERDIVDLLFGANK